VFFDTATYLVFLTVVVIAVRCLSHSRQNTLLLFASYFFYGWWDIRFLGLMMGSTLVDYWLAQGIEVTAEPRARWRFLILSLLMNFGLLGVFKYFNFFVDSFATIAAAVGLGNVPHRIWEIALPPGISFYTFQAVAYIVDVYRREIPAVRSLRDYGLFISLFPHLIAGPIQRPSHLIPQVQEDRRFDWEQSFDGIVLIIEGLFRKVVVADNCALIANAAFGGKFGGSNATASMLGILAFAFQIYGDFSGYSSIARGSAQLLGFHFMVNFRQPYLAESLSDFWRRWHISLSSWLRDYLYIGLGGNRRGPTRTYVNLFVTMLLGGLWHGANWTFVIWGALHGAGLALERAFGWSGGDQALRTTATTVLRRLLVFCFVALGWVFFRAATFGEAVRVLQGLGTFSDVPIAGAATVYLLAHIIPLGLLDLTLERSGGEYLGAKRSYGSRILIGTVLVATCFLFGANDQSAFIYFQF
jgi:alginate O-acetyltransferase complex protein AlgI